MIFPYAEFEHDGSRTFRPMIPVVFSHDGIRIATVALVDTGADQTMLPLSLACTFGFHFDSGDRETWEGAGGGFFIVFRSPVPIEHRIEQKGFPPFHWKSQVCFTVQQPTILLGYRGCLERDNLLFKGKERVLELKGA